MDGKMIRTLVASVVCFGLFAAPIAGAEPSSVSSGPVTLGEAPGGVRPELNGQRLSPVAGDDVYLVLDGKRRQIPGADTYRNLFCSWADIVEVIDIESVANGGALSEGATLLRAYDSDPVYLVSNGLKREVAEGSMDKYGFCGDKVNEADEGVVDAIPTGPGIK